MAQSVLPLHKQTTGDLHDDAKDPTIVSVDSPLTAYSTSSNRLAHSRRRRNFPSSSHQNRENSGGDQGQREQQRRRRQQRRRQEWRDARQKRRMVFGCGIVQLTMGCLLMVWDWTAPLMTLVDSVVNVIEPTVTTGLEPASPQIEIEDSRLDEFLETVNITAQLLRTSTAPGYPPELFGPLQVHHFLSSNTTMTEHTLDMDKSTRTVDYTIKVLQEMGVERSNLVQRQLENFVPPWSQIVDNYGSDAIILGLERCEEFRDRVATGHIGPAGIFSSGTNLLQQMLFENCVPPSQPKQLRPRIFNLWQAPWGKHNPEGARLRHIAMAQEFRNQSAVLPVVTIRHPYTWLLSICSHPYALVWKHNMEACERSLLLKNPVKALWGALHTLQKEANRTTVGSNENLFNKIPESYPSLIHTWRDWYQDYFQQTNYPLLMVRFEDLVFRPKTVVQKVCECAGGHLRPDEPFQYLIGSANLGTGHGDHRSDLAAAFLKYGQSLSTYRKKLYSSDDWEILDRVLDEDGGLFEAFGYIRP